MKYTITTKQTETKVYLLTYTIEADSEEKAKEAILSGDYTPDDEEYFDSRYDETIEGIDECK